MPLRAGDRLGPYEITSAIGAGGMGEVYKARDTRLNRTVAVKILPHALASDPEFHARFRREAETIAAFNHPHICVVHDVGEHDGTKYLVMEYLDGETLADRLRRGAPALDVTVRIGIQVSEALAAAHRRGIVHRDLKPGNVVLTAAGTRSGEPLHAKLLDFGIAKPLAPVLDPAAHTVADTRPLATAEGTLLGTLHYMAPEVIAGKPADARSDIFALGVMLYEMATGRRAFDGDSSAALIGAIMRTEPPPIAADTPARRRFGRIVAKCLAKDPEARWQSASDLADELRWTLDEPDAAIAAGAAPAAAWWRNPAGLIAAGLAALAVLSGIALAIVVMRTPRAAPSTVRLSIVPPAPLRLSYNDASYAPTFAVSPDGRRIVFVAEAPGEPPRLFVRSLDAVTPQAIPGTEGALGPFWSPDGSALGFFARAKLKVVGLNGAPPRDLADTGYDVTSGAWNRDGVIVFGGVTGSPLRRISADGGAVMPATELDAARKETGHAWPEFLPDGRRFLFFVRSGDPANTGVYLASLDAPGKTLVVASGTRAVFVPPDSLLFEQAGNVLIQKLDAWTKPMGRAVAIGERVTPRYGPNHLPMSLGGTTLAYWFGSVLGGRPLTELQWFDRVGRPLGRIGETGHFDSPTISADGRRVVVSRVEPDGFGQSVWSIDLTTGVSSPRTFGPGLGRIALLSRDGRELVFSALTRGVSSLSRRTLEGGAEVPVLPPGHHHTTFPTDWVDDTLVYQALVRDKGWDIYTYDLTTRQARPLVEGPYNDVQGRISPDRKWLAYSSQDTGAMNVYVRSYPTAGIKVQVTTEGGSQPVWSPDGRELYYLAPDGALIAVPVRGDRVFETGKPVRLFATRAANLLVPFWTQYAVGADGRFLVNNVAPDTPPATITVVLNWKP